MPLSMINLDDRTTRVCSADSAVRLKFVEQSKADLEAGKPAAREKRRPIRWLKIEDCDEVGPDALRITYRPLNDEEQLQCTGGLPALDRAALGPAYVKAAHLGVTSITGLTAKGERIDAQTPREVRVALSRMHAVHLEPLGECVLEESTGHAIPLDSSE